MADYYESENSLDSDRFSSHAHRAGKPMAALHAQGKDFAAAAAAAAACTTVSGTTGATGKQRKRLNIALLRRGGMKGNSNYSSPGTLMNQAGFVDGGATTVALAMASKKRGEARRRGRATTKMRGMVGLQVGNNYYFKTLDFRKNTKKQVVQQ